MKLIIAMLRGIYTVTDNWLIDCDESNQILTIEPKYGQKQSDNEKVLRNKVLLVAQSFRSNNNEIEMLGIICKEGKVKKLIENEDFDEMDVDYKIFPDRHSIVKSDHNSNSIDWSKKPIDLTFRQLIKLIDGTL